jgi:phosphatidylglycerol:prolipoprotein diacylglycerol transferase
MLGSRLFYVIFHLEEIRGNWLSIIVPFDETGAFGIAGLSMMGGVVLAIASALIYSYIKKIRFVDLGDAIAPGFLIGESITRIGCFLNGCCFGRCTESAFGVVFPASSPAGYAFPNQHVHPTQLYASVSTLLLFFLVLWLDKKHSFPGYTVSLTLFFFSVNRIFIDLFRFFEERQVLFNIGESSFSVNDVLSLSILLLSVLIFLFVY